jgi:hypothetical protein
MERPTTINTLGLSFSAVLAACVFCLSPVQTAVAEDGTSFAVSPRLYYTWIDTSDYSETASVPMGGLSLTFAPRGSNWDFTVNALVGNGDSAMTALAEKLSEYGQSGTFEIDRKDYEFVIRYRLDNSPVYIGFGVRSVNLKEDYIGDIDGLLETDETDLSFAEFGVGFSSAVSEGSRHSMFANLLLGIGKFDYSADEFGYAQYSDDGSALLFDANVGYQYVIGKSTSISARYRVIAVNTYGEEDDGNMVHGPEVAFTFRF